MDDLFKLPWVLTKPTHGEEIPPGNPDLQTGRRTVGGIRRRRAPIADPLGIPQAEIYGDEAQAFKLDFARSMDTFSKSVFEPAMDEIGNTWVDPLYVLPVGSRPFDTSPYGAMDMILNAQELVMPGPAFPYSQYYREGTDFIPYEFYVSVDWKLGDWDEEPALNESPKYKSASTAFYIDVAPLAMISRGSWFPRDKTFSRRIRSSYDNITDLAKDVVYPNYRWALQVESTISELAHSTCSISDWKTHMVQGPVFQFGLAPWLEQSQMSISGVYRVAKDADDPAVAPFFRLLDELWGREGLRHGHQEIARDPADGVYIPPKQLGPDGRYSGPIVLGIPPDTYVFPGGFRCAR